MNEDILNQSIRQFLKHVGIHSQRAIEKAAAAAERSGAKSFPATMRLKIDGLGVDVEFDGEIRME